MKCSARSCRALEPDWKESHGADKREGEPWSEGRQVGATISVTPSTFRQAANGGCYLEGATLTIHEGDTTFLKAKVPWFSVDDGAKATFGHNVLAELFLVECDFGRGSAWLERFASFLETTPPRLIMA